MGPRSRSPACCCRQAIRARALAHFQRVLQANPDDQAALAGAGEASFQLGDYTRAQQYLHAVTTDADRTLELHTLADLVIASDPLAPRLPRAERSRRLIAALSHTINRLDGCRTRTVPDDSEPRPCRRPRRRTAL